MSNDVIDRIFHLYRTRGHMRYGEAVTVLEHSLQTAAQAKAAGGNDMIVAASLLHDIGLLLLDEGAADTGVDTHHEIVGARALQIHFKPRISTAVRLHVEAKRYLCATDSDYFDGLSRASRKRLILQGGPMTNQEIRAFKSIADYDLAVLLRRFDDRAKTPSLTVSRIGHYRRRLANVLL